MNNQTSNRLLLLFALALPALPGNGPLRPSGQGPGDADTTLVAFTVRPIQKEITLHQPLQLTLHLQNVSAVKAEVDLGRDRVGGITVTAIRPDGTIRSSRLIAAEGAARTGRIFLDPGERYEQVILADRWIDLRPPGMYKIQIELEKPVTLADGKSIRTAPTTLVVTVGPSDKAALAQFCETILGQLLSAESYEAALDSAWALSYVQDAVAIPYLQRALGDQYPVQGVLAQGLERIGTDEATEALLRAVEAKACRDHTAVKQSLERMSAKTHDQTLLARIQAVLRE